MDRCKRVRLLDVQPEGKGTYELSCDAFFCKAILSTQLAVGELLLNSAICLCAMSGAMALMQSHRNSSNTISRLELLIVPFGLLKEMRSWEMSDGHLKWKTVDGSADNSPTTTPPMPWLKASTIPMKSGQPETKSLHSVGRWIEAHSMVQMSRIALRSAPFWCR
jgi:hypothetical protein